MKVWKRLTIAGAVAMTTTGLVVLTVRVRRRVRERRRMAQAALRDPLTGLANRTQLAQQMEAALLEAAKSGHRVGVLFCDLDNFGKINKSHGHAAGDLLLAASALQIEAAVRPADTVARSGGDEFVIVCPGLPAAEEEAAEALGAIADRVRRAVCEPTTIGGEAVSLVISIGAAVSQELDGLDAQAEAERLLQLADHAMLRSKRSSADRDGADNKPGSKRAG